MDACRSDGYVYLPGGGGTAAGGELVHLSVELQCSSLENSVTYPWWTNREPNRHADRR